MLMSIVSHRTRVTFLQCVLDLLLMCHPPQVLPRFSCLFAILKLCCSMTLWIVVALCFLRSLRCFLRISLFSSVASIFSLAVVCVLRYEILCFFREFAVSFGAALPFFTSANQRFSDVVDHIV